MAANGPANHKFPSWLAQLVRRRKSENLGIGESENRRIGETWDLRTSVVNKRDEPFDRAGRSSDYALIFSEIDADST